MQNLCQFRPQTNWKVSCAIQSYVKKLSDVSVWRHTVLIYEDSIRASEMQYELGWTLNTKTNRKYFMQFYQIFSTYFQFKDTYEN